MRFLVLGDTHGRKDAIVHAIAQAGDIDGIIHTGDYLRDLDEVALAAGESMDCLELYGVLGNCDGFRDEYIVRSVKYEKDEIMIRKGGVSILVCHGHTYGVKSSLNSLYYRCEELGVDAVIFGHTHVAARTRLGDIYFFNPGSLSSPKGQPFKTFGILDLNPDVRSVEFSLKKLV
jgi:uncharacterized protein